MSKFTRDATVDLVMLRSGHRVIHAAAVGLLLWAGPLAAQRLRVKETAGIRRFSYPVTAPGFRSNVPENRLQLLEDGKTVPAQFRNGDIDFNVSLGPLEQREYTIGVTPEAVTPPLELARATITQDQSCFTIAFTPSLQFEVPGNLIGLLSAVKTPRWDYLRPGSQGLLLRYRDDILYRVGGFGPWGTPTQARILKDGPLASALEFRSIEALRSNRSVESRVVMEFPRSKSWVKTSWTVEDPESLITGLGADLNLNVAGEPALVHFGGSTLVYGQLRGAQTAALVGGPQSWRVLLSPPGASGGAPEPYVTGKPGAAEGWAHIMDRERATAMAVEGFGARQDRIEAGAGGRLQIWREVRGGGRKTLTFWLHFVSMPVEVGAATSPQSILAPLEVEWLWSQKN